MPLNREFDTESTPYPKWDCELCESNSEKALKDTLSSVTVELHGMHSCLSRRFLSTCSQRVEKHDGTLFGGDLLVKPRKDFELKVRCHVVSKAGEERITYISRLLLP